MIYLSEIKNVDITDIINIIKEKNKNADVEKVIKAYEFAKKKDYLQKQVDEYEKNGYAYTLDPQRQKYFSEFIREKISEGICTREELKQACLDNGMTLA